MTAPEPSPIGAEQLRAGDILLSAGPGETSAAIRALDGGTYSHAALWSADGVIESTTPKVCEGSLLESVRSHPRLYVDVFRCSRMEQRGAEVVAAARRYVGRPYSYGDLALSALVLASSTWLPTSEWQVRYLREVTGMNRLLRLDEPGPGELVTCTELVARALLEAGVSFRIRTKPTGHLDLATFWSGIHRFTGDALAQKSLLPPTETSGTEPAWEELRAEARQRYLALIRSSAGIPEGVGGALSMVHAAAPTVATVGHEWGPNLVTPRHLETSPDMTRLGRLYCQKW